MLIYLIKKKSNKFNLNNNTKKMIILKLVIKEHLDSGETSK